MKQKWITRACVAAGLAAFACVSLRSVRGQTAATAAPNILLLVEQEFKPGNGSAREKLESEVTQAWGKFEVPNLWIDLEAITGKPKTLTFDPFDSFAQLDDAAAAWAKLELEHPDLASMQEDIRGLELGERTIIAVRRNDLSYQANSIDLSKMRFMRVLEVRLLPGREAEFTEAFKTLRAAYEKIKADTPWVVYQVNVGMPSPTFLVFVPMRLLKQNDDLLAWRPLLREAEGDVASKRMEQIEREAYSSMESNLYAVRPDLSHVSRDYTEGDPDFWTPKFVGPPEPKPESVPSQQ